MPFPRPPPIRRTRQFTAGSWDAWDASHLATHAFPPASRRRLRPPPLHPSSRAPDVTLRGCAPPEPRGPSPSSSSSWPPRRPLAQGRVLLRAKRLSRRRSTCATWATVSGRGSRHAPPMPVAPMAIDRTRSHGARGDVLRPTCEPRRAHHHRRRDEGCPRSAPAKRACVPGVRPRRIERSGIRLDAVAAPSRRATNHAVPRSIAIDTSGILSDENAIEHTVIAHSATGEVVELGQQFDVVRRYEDPSRTAQTPSVRDASSHLIRSNAVTFGSNNCPTRPRQSRAEPRASSEACARGSRRSAAHRLVQTSRAPSRTSTASATGRMGYVEAQKRNYPIGTGVTEPAELLAQTLGSEC